MKRIEVWIALTGMSKLRQERSEVRWTFLSVGRAVLGQKCPSYGKVLGQEYPSYGNIAVMYDGHSCPSVAQCSDMNFQATNFLRYFCGGLVYGILSNNQCLYAKLL